MTPQQLLELCDKFCTYIDAIKEKVQLYHDNIVPQVMNETKDNPAPFTNAELYLYKNIAKKFCLGLDAIYSQINALDHDIEIALAWRKQYERKAQVHKQEHDMTPQEALAVLGKKFGPDILKMLQQIKPEDMK